MSEEDLRGALIARFLPEYEESTKRLADSRSKRAVLSDEEWWQQTNGRLSAQNPRFAQNLEANKAEMIRQRHAVDAAREEVTPEMLARRRSEEVLPALLKIRRLRRARGPMTENQYHAACLAASLAQIATMRRKIKDAAEQAEDPQRRRILETLSGNVLNDLKAMRTLSKPSVNEDRIDEVSKEIALRFKDLTDALCEERV